MAQGPVMTTPLVGAPVRPTEEELYQIEQCEKIIRFRDSVLAGDHPRIKVPARLARKKAGTAQPPTPSAPVFASAPSQFHSIGNSLSFASNQLRQSSPVSSTTSYSRANPAKPFGTGNTEINPVLLEKSDHLIKAEIQIQRQRLEQSLREQAEQRRVSAKASLQSADPITEIDLSDVLTRAQGLVQAATTSDQVLAANASAAASDSFDENTFYSSHHDTPDPPSPRTRNDSPDVHMTEGSDVVLATTHAKNAFQPPPSTAHSTALKRISPPRHGVQRRPVDDAPFQTFQRLVNAQPSAGHYRPAAPDSRRQDIYGEDGSASNGIESRPELNSSLESGEASRSEESANERAAEPVIPGLGQQRMLPVAPVVRAHDLSPIAPQPAHVSPLVTARQQPGMDAEAVLTGAPAQVATLRGEAAGTSPESSPQGGRTSKKKGKKKKKKADRQAPEGLVSPYIKPEPRSPSPLMAPTFPRPNKKQRQLAQRQSISAFYDDARLDGAMAGQAQNERLPPRLYREELFPYGQEKPDEGWGNPPHPRVVSSSSRFEQYPESLVHPGAGSGQYARHVQSPTSYSVPYGFREAQPTRSASQMMADRQWYEPPQGVPEYVPRMINRPEADRARSRSPVARDRQHMAMAPPKVYPTLVIDAYGREYYEPPRPPAIRQSAVPMMRQAEPETLYDRPPIRAASTRPAPGLYEEERILYRPTSPAFSGQRRVLAQSELAATEYRAYRQRDYEARPLAHAADEYVQVRPGTERRAIEDIAREYIPRAASVRPAEPARYELPREYGRVQSMRPEAPIREYVPSAHPESRGQMLQQLPAEYSFRPAEEPMIRRAYSVRPVERYYEAPPRMEEVTYIERARAPPQGVVYNEDLLREQYH